MLAAPTLGLIESELRHRAPPITDGIGASLAAVVFSGPWGDVLTDVAAHGAYLDERTGRDLQVFFAGVLPTRTHEWMPDIEGLRDWYDGELMILTDPVRTPHDASHRQARLSRGNGWVWSPRGFNELRKEIENASGGSWRFSGNSDLLLANFLHGPGIEPVIDWDSLVTVALEPLGHSRHGRWFGEAVEQLARSCENRDATDTQWGMGALAATDPEHLGGSISSRSLKYFILEVLGPWAGDVALTRLFRV